MNMNEIFNIKRLGKVIRYDFNLVFEKYLKSILPIALFAYFIGLVIQLITSGKVLNEVMMTGEARIVGILFVGAITLFIAPYVVYSSVNHKAKGVTFATMPASALEKFLSMFLYIVILMPAAAGIALYAEDFLMVLISRMLGFGFQDFIMSQNAYFVLTDANTIFLVILVLTTAMCGNLLFKHNKILKTLAAIIIINIIAAILLTQIIRFQLMPIMDPLVGELATADGGISMEIFNYYGVRMTANAVTPIILMALSFWKIKTQKY